MKTLSNIAKVLAALVAIAGAVYVALTYGDKIVSWVRKTLGFYRKEVACGCEGCDDCQCEFHGEDDTVIEEDFEE